MKHSALLKMHDYLNGRWAHQNCVRAFIPPQPPSIILKNLEEYLSVVAISYRWGWRRE